MPKVPKGSISKARGLVVAAEGRKRRRELGIGEFNENLDIDLDKPLDVVDVKCPNCGTVVKVLNKTKI